jgi:hypothetical protein
VAVGVMLGLTIRVGEELGRGERVAEGEALLVGVSGEVVTLAMEGICVEVFWTTAQPASIYMAKMTHNEMIFRPEAEPWGFGMLYGDNYTQFASLAHIVCLNCQPVLIQESRRTLPHQVNPCLFSRVWNSRA